MASSIQSPAVGRKCQSVKKKTELSLPMITTTSATTTCSSTITTTAIDNTSWKDRFNTEILSTKNNSSNNPLFTSERYNETIELINNAKLKRYSDRTHQKFQKNSCYHRVIKHSPYSILFGHEPKIGLLSTSLHSSIFDSISTEEELENQLGLSAGDSNTVRQVESDYQTEEAGLANDDEHIDNDQGDSHSDSDNEHSISSFNDRIQRTNELREDARKGQKRQAEEFLQNTFKKQKLANLNLGDNVLVPVPDIDRGPTDARNILAVIMGIKHDKYKLGTQNGILSGYYSYHQVSKAPGLPTLFIQDIQKDEPKSLREIVRLQSITGGQGLLKCHCKGGCKTNRWKCKQANMLCNSRCHHSATCNNK
ncbi:unnamed protein product [Rotaria sordida]|uniref:Uncharacterized protein n=1 Tax=Rotaria sordida TaxID=392033 RepID=A0A819L9H7_9BILA|nr:unnamed protein product [Rotaria sordida]CAF1440731.1 unnamed protein product [Rotaria sordida]CAF3935444.1 unnamed protein product [Rotaria sordida]CAF3957781.1 unnamed protein product [Rotaria sordida]